MSDRTIHASLGSIWNGVRRLIVESSYQHGHLANSEANTAADRLLAVAREVPSEYRAGSPSIFATPLFCHLENSGLSARTWPLPLVKAATSELRLVYSPGKVGGKTVQATTQRLFPNSEIYHLHHLHELRFLEGVAKSTADPALIANCRVQICHAHWLTMLLELNRSLRAADRGVAKPTLVAGVREPVALRLSGSFENAAYLQREMNVGDLESIRDLMVSYFRLEYRWTWFRDELKPALGIDVFAEPFPTEIGWKIYENDRARLLVIRQESLTKLPDALAELYRLPQSRIAVASSNCAEDKGAAYAQRYREVKRALRFTDRELDLAYALPYARHFYSPNEIDAFRMRWADGGRDANMLRRAA